ncbi:MAG TPA: zinc ribbon domain-containing protein [Candidatus Enterenecus stercoripullorum]|nr:zinc ribbon domain-containing protein [Candidatus Enterenecus stercoripullorum]
MTRDTAIVQIESLKDYCERMADDDESGSHVFDLDGQALDRALSALRPVSREQVEKVWAGCEKCHNQSNWPAWIEKGFVYCPKCGTPLTSWAWKKQIERLETLKDADD